MSSRLGAEALGTFWLVFGGCGSAIFASKFLAPNVVAGQSVQLGIGFLGVSLAFGLTVMTMAYAVGHVSGAHFNPAVTIGAAVANRFAWRDVPAYVITQVVAGLLAGAALYGIARGKDGFDATGNMAANGYGDHSPGGYSLVAVLCAEVLLTAFFLYIILGSTDSRAPVGFAPIAIGLGPDADPPHLDPDQQHLGQPRPLDRRGLLQRRRSPRAALAVLGGPDRRRRHRRRDLPRSSPASTGATRTSPARSTPMTPAPSALPDAARRPREPRTAAMVPGSRAERRSIA